MPDTNLPNDFMSRLAGPPQRSSDVADILRVAWTVLLPIVNQKLIQQGYLPAGWRPERALVDIFTNVRKQQEIQSILWSAADTKSWERLIDAVLVAAGADPTAASTEQKRKWFSSWATTLSPLIYMFLGEETYDSLFGTRGSPMVAAKGIFEAYKDFGIDAASAINLANNFLLFVGNNNQLRQGFSNPELAEILKASAKEGLITPTINGNDFIQQVTEILPLFRAVKDHLAKQLEGSGKAPTIQDTVEAVKRLYEANPGITPIELAQRFRIQSYITEKAPYGIFQAGVLAARVRPPIAPKVYTETDKILVQNARESPLANMMGATIRAVHAFGAGGPLRRFYESMKTGNLPRILPMQWVQMAEASGIPRHMAVTLLRQEERNLSFITPELERVIRLNQAKYDIYPHIARIFQTYRDPELRAGALARLGATFGYPGVGTVDPGQYMLFMHSNLINQKAREALIAAKHYANLEHQTAGVLETSPMRRIMNVLNQPPRKPTGDLDIGKMIRDVINVIPMKPEVVENPWSPSAEDLETAREVTRKVFLPELLDNSKQRNVL